MLISSPQQWPCFDFIKIDFGLCNVLVKFHHFRSDFITKEFFLLSGIEFQFQEKLVGGAAIDAVGTPLPDDTLEACKASDAVLLAAIGGYAFFFVPSVFQCSTFFYIANNTKSDTHICSNEFFYYSKMSQILGAFFCTLVF